MSHLWLLAVRNLRVRLMRTVLTMAGIVLGVAVILAIDITNESTLSAINDVFSESAGRAHLIIEPAAASSGGFEQGVVRRVTPVDGVQIAVPSLRVRSLLAKEADQWQLGLGIGGGTTANDLILYGVDPLADRQVRDYEVAAGAFLPADPEAYALLLVDEYATEHEVALGQEVEVLTPDGPVSLEVVGLISKKGAGRLNNGSVGFVPLQALQKLFSRGRNIDQIDVVATPYAAATPSRLEELKVRLEQRLGKGYTVLYPSARGEVVGQMLANYQQGLGFFSALALFVGAFLVYNAFAMTVVERTREIGMMRALGFTRRQVLWLMLLEALILGSAGSFLGLFGGIGLARGLTRVMAVITATEVSTLTVPLGGVLTSLVVGSLVTLVAAMIPAVQASRISPLEAIRLRSGGSDGLGWMLHYGWLPGTVLVGLSLCGLYLPFRPEVSYTINVTSVFTLMLGVTLCLPKLIGPAQRLLRPALILIYGHQGRLGGDNIRRSQGRTVLTVAALMIGVTMIIGTGSMTQSFRTDISDWVKAAIGGDLYVRSPIPMRLELGSRFAAIPGVEAVTPAQFFSVKRVTNPGSEGDDQLVFVAIDPRTYTDVAAFKFAAGQGDEQAMIDRLAEGGAVFISTTLADKYHLGPGDTLWLETNRGQHDFYVAGVIIEFTAQGYVLDGSWDDMRRYFGLNDADVFLVKLAPGASLDAVKQEMEERYGKSRHLNIESSRDFGQRILDLTAQSFALFDVLLLIAMIVAALGVVNTLLMNVMERTREIGGLRSLGMTKGQVAGMILAESGAMGAIGGLLGAAFGAFLSQVFVMAMNEMSGYALNYTFPGRALVVSLIIALLLSQGAALYPAWRAATVGVVEAIQHE